MNPFTPLYQNCNTGTSAAKWEELADGPEMLDLEPVGLCNFKCTMCPTGLGALGRPSGFMSIETHKAILEKAAPHLEAVRYIGFGEPTMHPLIVKFVEAATERGLLSHINTNGSKITKDLARQLTEAGLSSIKFSFQGTDRETYEMMRQIDFFDGMIAAIETMRWARSGRKLPYIAASTTTTDEKPWMVERFKQRLEPLVDALGIGKTIFEYIDMDKVPPKQRARLMKAAELSTVEKKHPSPCPEVFTKLTIHWDGAVRVCCNDFSGRTNLGNINKDSLSSIWRHPEMEDYRERLARKEYSGPLCSVCWDYMDLTGGADHGGVSQR